MTYIANTQKSIELKYSKSRNRNKENKINFVQFASVEYEIEKKEQAYYKALMAGQKNRYSKKEKIDKWVLFFLTTLKITIEKLDLNYQYIKEKKSYLNQRQTNALEYIRKSEPIKISDLVNSLSNYTSYILKKDMKYMVDEWLIKRIGKGRATTYIINEKRTKGYKL